MNDDEWRLIERLFHTARELNVEDRLRLLAQECGTDNMIRSTVETLLREDDKKHGLLDCPITDSISNVLSPGTLIGPYEVVSVVGEGGMGQVYRAVDRRLKRDVAIKALPIEFIHDRKRLAQLEVEATVLASVNHLNVATIYDVVETDESPPCLVMEFVDGSTLAESLETGQFAVDQVLGIAHQIALALEAAHNKGIVHRDLKPANIKRTADGTIKVLDFGLAKVFKDDAAEEDSPQPNSPASTGVYSEPAGTPSYMSPEQARSLPVDPRTDLWAFGCVIYELLTGRKAFRGRTVSEIIESILTDEPDWTLLPSDVPREMTSLLRQCLQKDINQRLESAESLRHSLEKMREPKVRVSSRLRYFAVASLVTAIAAATLLVVPKRSKSDTLRVEQTRQVTFTKELEIHPALSPDGKSVAYSLVGRDRSDIYIQPISGGSTVNLTGHLPTLLGVGIIER